MSSDLFSLEDRPVVCTAAGLTIHGEERCKETTGILNVCQIAFSTILDFLLMLSDCAGITILLMTKMINRFIPIA
jgi:hypothetical protein